jgi:hypothetical protein
MNNVNNSYSDPHEFKNISGLKLLQNLNKDL